MSFQNYGSLRSEEVPGSFIYIQMTYRLLKRSLIFALIACAIATTVSSGYIAYSQDERKIELTAQEILGRVDAFMAYPDGVIRGRLMHIMPTGKTHKVDVTGYVDGADYLFTFSTGERGEQLKVLYNFSGDDIWVYNMLSTKLFHKTGVDKFEPVVFTNFSFLDFSNIELQSNYTAKIIGDAFIKGEETYRLSLTPIFRGGNYGMLTVYVTKKEFQARRIDYHDIDRVLFKTLSIGETAKWKDRIFPVRYDMLDIRKGTLTILTYHDFDRNIKFDKKIFMRHQLGR